MTPEQQHKILCVMLASAQSAAGDDAPTADSAAEAAQTDNWIPYWTAVYDMLASRFGGGSADSGSPLTPTP